jgi:hypothetical protein
MRQEVALVSRQAVAKVLSSGWLTRVRVTPLPMEAPYERTHPSLGMEELRLMASAKFLRINLTLAACISIHSFELSTTSRGLRYGLMEDFFKRPRLSG